MRPEWGKTYKLSVARINSDKVDLIGQQERAAGVAVAEVAEVVEVKTLPEDFDVEKCQSELNKMKKELAAQGISKDFDYQAATA